MNILLLSAAIAAALAIFILLKLVSKDALNLCASFGGNLQ
jgi:hypothetical protein